MKRRQMVAVVVLAAVIVTGGWWNRKTAKVMGAETENNPVTAIVLPHHTLASQMISDAVSRTAAGRPEIETIVVLSPNHYNPRGETFTTADTLEEYVIDNDKIQDMKKKGLDIKIDSELLQQEHGLLVPMRYLSRVYVNAKFVPIAIGNNYSINKVKTMAEALVQLLPENSLFMASSDFSHEHTEMEARQFDKETVKTLIEGKTEALLKYDNDHTDCPACLAILLEISRIKKCGNFNLWEERHGAEITNNPLLVGTSYVTGAW